MSETPYLFMTGATGFIGTQLMREVTRDLPRKPWRAVRALVRNEAGAAQVRELGAEPLRGDLLEVSEDVRQAIAGARYVVHCAHPPTDRLEARAVMDENLVRAVDPARAARLVFVAGSSWFGTSSDGALIDEDAPPRPFAVASYFEAGLRALRAAGERGLDYAVAYIAGVYGHGSWFLRHYLQAIEEGQPIPVLDPAPVWPYIHIEDCIRALELLLVVPSEQLETVGRDVILTDHSPVPMDLFIEEVAQAMGRPANIERLGFAELEARLSPFDLAYLTANMPHSGARLRRLGFACRYPSVREGIRSLGLGGPAAR